MADSIPPARPSVADVCAEIERCKVRLEALTERTKWLPPDSKPLSFDDFHAIKCRWATGPERYQADADALIGALIHERQRVAPTNTADAVRAIVADCARVLRKASQVADDNALPGFSGSLNRDAERIERLYAPSAPVERMYTRAQVERVCDDAYAADALDEPGVTFAERVAALLDAPSASAKGER